MADYKKVLETIDFCRKEINEAVSEADNSNFYYAAKKALDELETKANFFGGYQSKATIVTQVTSMPMTEEFMGRPIPKLEKVTIQDLVPIPTIKKALKDKVEDAFNLIHLRKDITATELLEKYKTADDLLVLRALGKRVGVEGVKTREINPEFVNEVIAGVRVKAAKTLAEQQYEKELTENTEEAEEV